tara:strand:+ start:14343 stop:15092 length:750 start_codon:yes stop_codon:yes gene_type:complete
MSLNAKKAPKAGGNKDIVAQEALEAGTYPARVVSIIDLGLQPQRPYQGQEKPPKQEIKITYELLDEFCLDEAGEEIEDKPRWVSEDIPFNNLDVDLAKSTKRYNALDPDGSLDGDFTQLLGLPCLVTLNATQGKGKNSDRTFNNVTTISQMRAKDVKKAAELVNEPKFFSCSEPDLEIFRSLPEFQQNKIKDNLEYNGSVLQKLLSPSKGEEPEQEPDLPEGDEAAPKKTKPASKKAIVEDEEEDDDKW